jgi:RNA polymerase sigma-70 factor (ECF subfamily)
MNPQFYTTCWTVVIDSAKSNPAESRPALEALCRTYWAPLYAYAVSSGKSHEDAEDITQAFFGHLLEKNLPGGADPEVGRFRSYLLASLRYFMIDWHRHATSQRRGGANLTVPLREAEYLSTAGDTPEAAYDRKWAHILIGIALDTLAAEQDKVGHGDRFAMMRPLLLDPEGGRESAMAELVDRYDMTPGHIRTTLSRLRARFREIVRLEVSRLVADASEIDAEIAHLLRAMQ